MSIITRRVIIGFTRQIVESIYSRKIRQSVIDRLTDRQWRNAHLDSYKTFFSPNTNTMHEEVYPHKRVDKVSNFD